jgi:hypothetical protein
VLVLESCSRNRAWNPPTSSSLAEENASARSVVQDSGAAWLSTAVRDFPTLAAATNLASSSQLIVDRVLVKVLAQLGRQREDQ